MITYRTEEKNKFLESIENNYKPNFIITNTKLLNNFKKINLSEDAKKILNIPNAGGNSIISEIFSYEIIRIIFGVKLYKTETEIEYKHSGSKITDYIINLENKKIGVSVTRAFNYKAKYTKESAITLLHKKLDGVFWSSRNVLKKDKWSKQILHIFCENKNTADILKSAYRQLKSKLKTNTIILITIIDCNELFYEKKGLCKILFPKN